MATTGQRGIADRFSTGRRVDPGPARGRPGPGSREAIDVTPIRAGNIRPLLGLYLGGEASGIPLRWPGRASCAGKRCGRYWDRTSDLLGVNQVLPVSGGVCGGHRLPLNWAIAQIRLLQTSHDSSPEGSREWLPGLADQQPPCKFELTAGHLSSAGRGDLRLLAIGRCRGSPRQAMSAAVRRRCRGRW